MSDLAESHGRRRSRRNRVALACLVLLGGLILILQSVRGDPAKPRILREQTARFALRATHGYRIFVTAETQPKSSAWISPNSQVMLSAVHSSAVGDDQEVSYTTQRAGHSTTIHASFGRFGVIAIRFIPSGKVLRAQAPSCSGGSGSSVVVTRLGTFVGRIRFRGEGGYTTADASRAAGGVGDFDGPLREGERIPCEPSLGGFPGHFEESAAAKPVHLIAKDRHRDISFEVSPSSPSSADSSPQIYSFGDLGTELRGTLLIARTVAVRGPASDFVFDNSLSTATVTPPLPFTGTAKFQRRAGGPRWTGTLTGPLPGRGIVRLAGPGFTGELRAGPRKPIGG